ALDRRLVRQRGRPALLRAAGLPAGRRVPVPRGPGARPGIHPAAHHAVSRAGGMSAGAPAAGRVLLVHGLWMPPLAMRWFASKLRALGFDTGVVGYRSIVGSTGAAVERIRGRLRGGGPTHVVGHSLGGLLALEAVRGEPSLPVARIACL